MSVTENRQSQLLTNGYCTIPNILSSTLLKSLQERFNAKRLQETYEENFGQSGAFVKLSYEDPIVVDLLTWPATLAALKELGFPKPKLHSFYVSTKPPKTEKLAWHSDLFYEYKEIKPAELFLIYYLQDTSPENGCLRVIPGSHLKPDTAHEPVDVPLKAGDLFIGDRRILHATHENSSEQWRTCLTIAYAPMFDELSEPIQAMIVNNPCLPPRGWHNDPDVKLDPRLATILPIYNGTAKPINELK